MKKLIVVGGGASGIVSGIFARKEGYDVTILERNSSVLKKLQITGNGRCNYFNDDFTVKHFYSDNIDVLDKIINEENKDSILKFFSSIGIIPNIKNGYYYPYSNSSLTVKEALILEAKLSGVKFEEDIYVTSIEKKDKIFNIETSRGNFICNKVILSTGSSAYPKTGSDGNGYILAKNLGHDVTDILPALVQLEGKGSCLKKWEGVRCTSTVSLYHNDKLIKEETGELQLLKYGISGICVFNISGLVSKYLNVGENFNVKINFVPFTNCKTSYELIKWFDKRNELIKNRTVKDHLDLFLNYKLTNTMLSLTNINDEEYWDNLNNNKKLSLCNNLISFDFKVTKTKGFDNSQVCQGGVLLDEINPYTMESLIVKDLYITGELLDVYGDCGGYNLGFAFITGMLAGKGVNND